MTRRRRICHRQPPDQHLCLRGPGPDVALDQRGGDPCPLRDRLLHRFAPAHDDHRRGYEQFVFGYIRFAHFAAGWVLAIGFLGRIYWAFFGNHHARQLFYVPFWKAEFWKEVLFEIRWYLFLAKEPKKYVGHNPLAQLAMFFFITWASAS